MRIMIESIQFWGLPTHEQCKQCLKFTKATTTTSQPFTCVAQPSQLYLGFQGGTWSSQVFQKLEALSAVSSMQCAH